MRSGARSAPSSCRKLRSWMVSSTGTRSSSGRYFDIWLVTCQSATSDGGRKGRTHGLRCRRRYSLRHGRTSIRANDRPGKWRSAPCGRRNTGSKRPRASSSRPRPRWSENRPSPQLIWRSFSRSTTTRGSGDAMDGASLRMTDPSASWRPAGRRPRAVPGGARVLLPPSLHGPVGSPGADWYNSAATTVIGEPVASTSVGVWACQARAPARRAGLPCGGRSSTSMATR